jgi:hypothetical protein
MRSRGVVFVVLVDAPGALNNAVERAGAWLKSHRLKAEIDIVLLRGKGVFL